MRLLYAGRFDIPGILRQVAVGEAPSNHLHGVPLLASYGWQVCGLDLSAQELAEPRAFQRRLWRERASYDVVLAHNYYDVRWLAMARAAGLLRARLAAFVHSLRPRPWDRVLMHGYDHLFTLSECAMAAVRRGGGPAARQTYFAYGADLRFYREQPWPISPGIVLSVGVSGRDFATLIGAARDIDAEVHIVGRVDARDMRDAPKNVHFHSTGNYDLPFAALTGLFARAGCVVVTHHGSDHPYGLNAVVEAMAYGRPLVMSAGPGIDIDPVALGRGLRVAPHDTAALARAVTAVLSDDVAARAMGGRARAAVAGKFNANVMAAQLDRALRELCET
ncbi:MAG: glycosyltransferase family 4 protein [Gammaproteobacteria bacterium]|nr:glycosyltransferase family 4 protein [Gammaproteobacteria bacterium]